MMRTVGSASLLLAIASQAHAQFGPPSGSNPYSGNNPYSGGDGSSGFGSSPFAQFFSGNINNAVTAHAALATVAFGLLFPVGSILIRLASFRGLWLVHGIIQLFGYLIYIAAAGIGIWMATHARMLNRAHPIIGLILLGVLFIQPFLGVIHHFCFKKYSKRVFWSYAHIWLGRGIITLGIINGGLGLQLAKQTGLFPPKQSTIIGYSVAAAVVWLIYIACAIFGETRRKRARAQAIPAGTAPPPYKRESPSDSDEGVRYA